MAQELEDQRRIKLEVDGKPVEVPEDGSSLLMVLREQLGIRSLKDGCSPQGQCGCCTVLVDGQPRVACVTPARRVQSRAITTLDGLDPEARQGWAESFAQCGASQCGFCTPGIILRLEGLRRRGTAPEDTAAVEQGLLAHLCRCTGWRTILDAWSGMTSSDRDDRPGAVLARRPGAAERAAIEGRNPQQVGSKVALGEGGFADDTAPDDALVAVPDGAGGWSVGESLREALDAAGKVQGRRTTSRLSYPPDITSGAWDVALRTTWVEPAYLETDASWCVPGGEPRSPLANGGAFGGKTSSPAPAAAQELANRFGRPVRVVLSREDSVRMGVKRPPMAAGVNADGSGVLRVVRTAGITEAIKAVAPGLHVEEVDVAGPPTSAALRAAGWAEASVLLAAAAAAASRELSPAVEIVSPDGARASARVTPADDPGVHVSVRCGRALDETTLRSYCIGAAHMALGWVSSEGLAVDADGAIEDLTIRSFGVLRAVDTPHIEVEIHPDDGPPVNGSDAVYAAVAAATWIAQGLPDAWPTGATLR